MAIVWTQIHRSMWSYSDWRFERGCTSVHAVYRCCLADHTAISNRIRVQRELSIHDS